MFCAGKFCNGDYSDEVSQFACLEVIEFAVRHRYNEMLAPQVHAVKNMLSDWLQAYVAGGPTQPASVRNKIAQLLVVVFVHQYPAEWPTFFQDVMAILPSGPQAVDMVLRILDTIDEEVVDRVFERPVVSWTVAALVVWCCPCSLLSDLDL